MTAFKGTPGPWRVDTGKLEMEENNATMDMPAVVSADGDWIAAIPPGDDAATDLANARLIAAAPALLEVLMEWQRIAKATGGQSVIHNRVEAAIAKALGEPVQVEDFD